MFDWLKKIGGFARRRKQQQESLPEPEFRPAKLPPRRIEQVQLYQGSRNPEIVEAKRIEAKRAADAFAEVLAAEGFPHYANDYRAISSALEFGYLERAIELESKIPQAGMGSLSDIYPKDEQVWGRASSAVSHAITGLRVYLSYGIHKQPDNDNSQNAS